MFSPELVLHLRAFTRIVYVVTDEEDNFILEFRKQMPKLADRTFVYNQAFGLLKIDDLINDWANRTHIHEGTQIHDALKRVYTDDPHENEHFYIFTDPEIILNDEMNVRRVLNLAHQLHNDPQIVKCLIFVGSSRFIPPKLARYIEVVEMRGLTPEDLKKVVEDSCANYDLAPPADYQNMFRGFTSYEIDQVITQSIITTMMDPRAPKEINPNFVSDYRQKQIRKTDLVQIINTRSYTFESVGGVERFKEWARATKSCWTPEGRKFGLRVPRGVLLMGVYGCGKSLGAKALATEWGVPLVQLEMGRLRNPAVGRSENNLIQALRIVETIGECGLWIDEAEKDLAGGSSSAQSDAGTTSRMLGILSTWAQEMSSPVSLILTANSLKNLPPEIVNRLPDRFFFDVPDESAIIEILTIHARDFAQDIAGFKLNELAKVSSGLVGREIEQCVESAMTASFNAKKPGLDEGILLQELKTKSRITSTMRDEINELVEWVGYNPETDDGVRAKLAAPKRRASNIKMVGAR